VHADERGRIRIRQRPQQHAVDDAEDRGGRADAERQRQHGDGGEPGRLDELTDGVADVSNRVREHQCSSSSRCRTLLQIADEAVCGEPAVRTIDVLEVVGETRPVAHVRGGARVGLGLGEARGEGVAIQILELRRHLANDARLTLGGQVGQAQPRTNERLPVTHRRGP